MKLANRNSANTTGNLIRKIVAEDLCISCGACVHACPDARLVMEFDHSRGGFGPRLAFPDNCHRCPAPCAEVCPSLDLNFPALLGKSGDASRYGPLISVFMGHSPFQRDGRSSSGGIIKAILTYLCQEEKRPVIALGEKAPGQYEPVLITTAEEIKNLPGSIYHNISFHQALALIKQAAEPAVVVATPCQLAAIKKYFRVVEPALAGRIHLSVGLICGWMFSHHAMKAFARYKKLAGEVTGAAYRGEDKVGKLKLYTASGVHQFSRRPKLREGFFPYFDYYAAFSRYANLLRCRVCEDHLNVLADIAVGDAWLQRAENRKESLILSRTARGDALISLLAARGFITLEPGTRADIDESQSEDLVMGYTARSLNAFLQKRGFTMPRFQFGDASEVRQGPSLWSFHLEMGMRSLLRQGWYKSYRAGYMLLRLPGNVKGALLQRARRLWGRGGN